MKLFLNKRIKVSALAILLRIIVAVLGWNTSFFEAYDNSITVVYQRSAYLLSFNYGYQQALPESPAYYELDSAMIYINSGQEYKTEISSVGRINTSHYPPGYPLIGSMLFDLTRIPIGFIYQIIGILLEFLTIYYLFKVATKIHSEKLANFAILIYAISPQAISLSISMTPDSLMPLLVISTVYYFLKYLEGYKFKYILFIACINGLGGYFRSDFILLPFAFNFIFLLNWRNNKFLELLKFNTTIIILTLLILTPWGMLNKQRTGEFNPTSTSLGATLVTGLAVLPNPWNLGPTDYDRFAEAQQQGYISPFEYEANTMFTNRFVEYVKEEPLYYTKACLYRTGYFIAAPHSWGLEADKYAKTYSELRNQGAVLGSINYLVSRYWSQLISSLISVLCFLALIVFLVKHNNITHKLIIVAVIISVWLSHVFIHITPVYIMSIYPLQCFLLAFLIFKVKNKKAES